MTCLHCGERKWIKGHRGLCRKCYDLPAVRALYPSRLNTRRTDGDLTEEELNALIARQLANLPPWWDAEAARAKEWEPHK